MPVVGNPRTFHKKFKFIVEIDGVASAGFQSCSELSSEIAKIEYYEGGSLIPQKSPGRVSFADVTLDRGAVTEDSDLYDWYRETARADANAGDNEPLFKRTLDIVQLDRDGSELRRWRLQGAWIVNFVAADEWNNDSDENVIESVTLTYDYFELA